MRPARVTEEPFEEVYRASLERQAGGGRRPRSFGQFLEWMRALWHAEMPIDMQAPGVFRGYADRPGAKERYALWARLSSLAQLAGGSLPGSPRDKDPFRQLMEESPFEVEFASYDGQTQPDPHYRRPLRAALARRP